MENAPSIPGANNKPVAYLPKGWWMMAVLFGHLPHAIMAYEDWRIFGQPDKGKKIMRLGIALFTIPMIAGFIGVLGLFPLVAAKFLGFGVWIIGIIFSNQWAKELLPIFEEKKAKGEISSKVKGGGLIYLVFFLVQLSFWLR